MEDFNKKSQVKKKRAKNTYPIYMDLDLIDKVKNWQEQVKKHFNGMVSVTVSDVCAEVLKNAETTLSPKILDSLEESKLDSVKKLKLLLKKAIEANKNEDKLSVKELIQENSALLGIDKKKKSGRKRQSKKSAIQSGILIDKGKNDV